MTAVRDVESITVVPEIQSRDELTTLHWKRRMYWAPFPPNLHSILAFIFEVEPRTLPAKVTSKASVTSDGFIMANCVDPHGRSHMGAFFGSFRAFEQECKERAAHNLMTPDEIQDFEDHLNDWLSPTTNYSGRRFKLS